MHPTPGRQLLDERERPGKKNAVCRSTWKISARVCRLLWFDKAHASLAVQMATADLVCGGDIKTDAQGAQWERLRMYAHSGTATASPSSAGQKPWRSTNPEEQYRPESLDQSKLQLSEGIRTFINTHAFRMRTPSEIPRSCWLTPQSRPHPLSSARMQRNKWGFASSLVYGFKIGNLEIPQISSKSRYLDPRMLSSHLRFGMSECPSRFSVRTTDWGIFWHRSLRVKMKADKINLKKKKTTAHFN